MLFVSLIFLLFMCGRRAVTIARSLLVLLILNPCIELLCVSCVELGIVRTKVVGAGVMFVFTLMRVLSWLVQLRGSILI